MEKLSWIFELIDKVSGPAKKAEEATGGFDKELKKVEAQIERIKNHPLEFKELKKKQQEFRELSQGPKSFATRMEEMNTSIRNLGFVQDVMLGVEAFKAMAEVGEAVVDVVYDIGKEIVEAAGHAERMQISFQTLAGDAEAGEALEYIEKIDKASEVSSGHLQDMGAQLLAAGFKAKELSNALPAALDIAGFMGGGADKVNQAVMALERIRTTGQVESRSMMSLGLGENAQEKVLGAIAKARGSSVDAIRKAMEQHKLNPQEVLAQVYQLIIARQHGALGTTAEKMTKTVTGRLEKLKQLPEEIFEKWAKSPGFARFSDALGKILAKLDPDGENGKKIFAALDRASMKVVEIVDKFASGDGIDTFTDGVVRVAADIDKIPAMLDKIATASEVIATIWTGAKIVGAVSSLTTVLPGLGTAFGTVAAVIGGAAAPFLAVAAAAGSLAVAVYRISAAVKELGGLKHVWQDFKDWAGGNKPALATGLGPPKGMHWDPTINGYRRDTPLVADGGIPAPSMRSKRGAGVNVSQSVDVGGIHISAPGGNPDEIAGAVNQSLPGAVQQASERLAVASGVMSGG